MKTGKANGDNLAIPAVPILFLDRLARQYGSAEYEDTCKRAVEWVFKNPMQTYLWQGQFEDIRPSAGYLNLSHKPAVLFSIYLFDHAKEKPEYTALAEELLRFSEDQFVVWEPCGAKEDRITPCALEQYQCYAPIVSTMARFIRTWTLAYKCTGNQEYLAKAQSLANSIVGFQARNGGQYHTYLYLTDNKKNRNWDNAATEAAMALMDLSAALGEKQGTHQMESRGRSPSRPGLLGPVAVPARTFGAGRRPGPVMVEAGRTGNETAVVPYAAYAIVS
ncbi:MAG: hypothetical protein NTU88_10790 [Armatimonadetes bacterium]|nr:hypothetical protein [Armatimonadota bacterium]